MPEAEEHIYHWEQTKSGFTVLFFMVTVMVAAFFAGPSIFAALQGGGSAIAGGLAPAAISGGEAALYAGAAYAGGSLATSSGPSSLTTTKDGIFGGIGDGKLTAGDPGSDQARDATKVLLKRHIQAEFDAYGTCAEDRTLCSTQAGMTGITPNPSSVVFGKDQQTIRTQEQYCKKLGLTGSILQNCIVPQSAPVDIP